MIDDPLAMQTSEASFERVTFPVENADTESGQDFAEHTALLAPGADIEPTGRKAKRGTLTVPCLNIPQLVEHYGEMFPGKYAELLRLWDEPRIGELFHPTRGSFRALMHRVREALVPTVRDGVVLTVEWVEHNAEASVNVADSGASPADTASRAEAEATAADDAMADVDPDHDGGWSPLSALAAASLLTLDSPAAPWSDKLAALNAMREATDTAIALSVFQPASAFGALSALSTFRATLDELEERYLPGSDSARRYSVPQTMALWQIAQAVYGDASKTSLLLAANAIPDPLFVPAGTVLLVLPAE